MRHLKIKYFPLFKYKHDKRERERERERDWSANNQICVTKSLTVISL